MSDLAIIIPAYKEMFFEQALSSIANQTCKNFTVYIGDDSSTYNLKSITDLYKDKINIVYKRYDENFGNRSLIAHWERCIDMADCEEWLWLFSDDDVMEENCVENFYRTIQLYRHYDLYHFNIYTINNLGDIIGLFNFPDVLSSEDFFLGRSFSGYQSFVVEYIFRKTHFLKSGRFEHFDLGWGSDDALWIKLSQKTGIKTINNARVRWRKSEFNISPNNKDKKILKRKFYAKIDYSCWIFKQVQQNNIKIDPNKIQEILEKRFLKDLKIHCESLTLKMLNEIFYHYYRHFTTLKFVKMKLLNLYSYRMYRLALKIMRR